MTERLPAGVVLLDKPAGLSSFAAIARLRPAVGRKVGHAGTLDPFATGLLVVCCGRATRLATFLSGADKRYRAVVRFGATSTTEDPEGTVTPTGGALPTTSRLTDALARFRGLVEQVPPAASAIHVDGERAYRRFRRGEQVEIPSRAVTIHDLDLVEHDEANGVATIELRCSTGTYVRSLARDIGEALGCGGLVEVLVRTRIGDFLLTDAVDPDALSAATIPGFLRPAAEAVAQLPAVRVTAAQAADLAMGRGVTVPGAPAGEVALLGPDGALVAVGEADAGGGGRVAPRRVLAGAS